MANTSNFFDKKKPWSIYKDQILDYYLAPYIGKILYTTKPLTIIDCFAGKGKFNDGAKGSPIIVAEHISTHLDKNISGYFIEKKYYNDLKNNIQGFKKCTPFQGTFEDNVKNIVSLPQSHNLFLYIDPYGVKSLNMDQFREIKNRGFYTLEMLMNFNAFGFLREGCNILKYKGLFDNPSIDTDYEIDDDEDIDIWDGIANGGYWKELITNYKNGKISMKQCEECFVQQYTEQLRKTLFKFVVNIPIKTKEENLPKYRLIFGTNHIDGLLLMTDSMHNAWLKIKEELFKQEQLSLFEVNEDDLKDHVLKTLPDSKSVLLKDIIVELIQQYGIQFSISEYKRVIKSMEGESLEITRIPPTTKKGRMAISMDFDEYKIFVHRKKT